MTSTTHFAPIRSGLFVAEIHRQLREAILDGTLKSGDPLRDSVLAEQMNVSRSPVREALRLLESAGLTTKSPNHSYVVVQFTESDLRELAGLRLALETLAARLIVGAQATVPDFSPILDEMNDALRSGDRAGVVRADHRFHSELVKLASSQRLQVAFERMHDQIELSLLSTDAPLRGWEGMLERHELLIELLTTGIADSDPRAIVNELEAHILRGMGCPDLMSSPASA